MNFSWSQAQLALKQQVIDFAEKELNHQVSERERNNVFPKAEWQKCADFGILGFAFDEKYGGKGYDPITSILLYEALGYGSSDNGLPYSLTSQILSTQVSINAFGSEPQKDHYLSKLIKGESIGAFGITEPDSAGSDSFNMRTTAVKTDKGYIINGEKHYISLAPVCNFAVVFAATNPQVGRWGITAFIVEKGSEGFTTSEVRDKMGMRSTPMGNLYFENCFVPEENRLGKEGAGLSLFTTAMESERGYIFACQVGRMEKQLELTVQFVNERKSSGQSIGKFQSISNRVANMRMRLETSKLLLYKVAYLDSVNQPLAREAAAAKLYISEAFVESSMDFMRIHGSRGYVTEFEIERDLRDSMGGLIYSGTSDIQRNILAKLEGVK